MTPDNYQYRFDNFLLIPNEGLLLQNNEVAPLSNRAFNVLLMMVKREGHIIQKQEFMDNVWADTFVEEGNLAVAVNSLRKTLHTENEEKKVYIETFPRRGYRFTAKVEIETIKELSNEVMIESVIPKKYSEPVENRKFIKVVNKSKVNTSVSQFFTQLKARKWLLAMLMFSFLSYGFTINGNFDTAQNNSPEANKIKIAVLPFVNLSPSDNTENLGFAFADAMMLELSQSNTFSVVSLISAAKYFQKIPTRQEIMKESDADYVITSTFIKDTDKVEVTSQLIEVKTGNIASVSKLNFKNEPISALKKTVVQELVSKITVNSNPILSASLKEHKQMQKELKN